LRHTDRINQARITFPVPVRAYFRGQWTEFEISRR
jgi:hypothetical protein